MSPRDRSCPRTQVFGRCSEAIEAPRQGNAPLPFVEEKVVEWRFRDMEDLGVGVYGSIGLPKLSVSKVGGSIGVA
jgi:hypothetical protein